MSKYGHPITISAQYMQYSDFHKNRVRYNSNTTNKAKSKNVIIYILKLYY